VYIAIVGVDPEREETIFWHTDEETTMSTRLVASKAHQTASKRVRQQSQNMARRKKRSAPRPESSRQRIYAEVRKVPRGKVATYGQIALLAGLEGQARQVGYAMAALPSSSTVPWHRVINAHGRVSTRAGGAGGTIIQQQLLEREGVVFDDGGRVSLERFRWKPRRR
jgi:methylated-DNA-protein-cysteine methyltransferase related protein